MKKGSGVGGRRSTRRSSAAALLETPPRVASPPSPDHSPPKSTLLNNSNKRVKKMTAARASSVIGSPSPAASKPLAAAESNGLASIFDLKNLDSSRLQDLKQHIDRSHTEIFKDCDSKSALRSSLSLYRSLIRIDFLCEKFVTVLVFLRFVINCLPFAY